MSDRNYAAMLAKKEKINTINNSFYSDGGIENAIFNIENERLDLEIQYELLRKEINSHNIYNLPVYPLARFFNCSKALGKNFYEGVIDGIKYKISDNNPSEIVFGNLYDDFLVVINDDVVYSEICVDETNHYAKLKDHDFNIVLNSKVYVVDGEINEYINITDAELKGNTLKEFEMVMKSLCHEIVNNNPDYLLSDNELGFFRNDIPFDEAIMKHTDLTDKILADYSTSNLSKKRNKSLLKQEYSILKYSDFIFLAEEYKNKCICLYDTIQKAINSEYILDNKSR